MGWKVAPTQHGAGRFGRAGVGTNKLSSTGSHENGGAGIYLSCPSAGGSCRTSFLILQGEPTSESLTALRWADAAQRPATPYHAGGSKGTCVWSADPAVVGTPPHGVLTRRRRAPFIPGSPGECDALLRRSNQWQRRRSRKTVSCPIASTSRISGGRDFPRGLRCPVAPLPDCPQTNDFPAPNREVDGLPKFSSSQVLKFSSSQTKSLMKIVGEGTGRLSLTNTPPVNNTDSRPTGTHCATALEQERSRLDPRSARSGTSEANFGGVQILSRPLGRIQASNVWKCGATYAPTMPAQEIQEMRSQTSLQRSERTAHALLGGCCPTADRNQPRPADVYLLLLSPLRPAVSPAANFARSGERRQGVGRNAGLIVRTRTSAGGLRPAGCISRARGRKSERCGVPGACPRRDYPCALPPCAAARGLPRRAADGRVGRCHPTRSLTSASHREKASATVASRRAATASSVRRGGHRR
jgi:hypothetical protein